MPEYLPKAIYQKAGRPRTSRPSRSHKIPKKLRDATYKRSGGRCDCCGLWMPQDAFDCHHRQLRSHGGKDEVENLLSLRHQCHMWLHQHPREATERGFMVHSWTDPADIPVRRYDGRLYLPRWTWEPVKENQ